jgi:carbon-monoxide dehydrogenase small subunit
MSETTAAEKRIISFTVNGIVREVLVEPRTTLLEALRDRLRLTGAKLGCGEGECGACTVLLDGLPVNSCLVLAVEAAGREVLTVEGVADGNDLHPLQQAFIEKGAVQCGFCTPGMILTSLAFLRENPDPTEDEVREAISGNLCRCTGYQKIVEAVLDAARRMGGGS